MSGALPGFLSIDDLADSQGELALSFEFDSNTQDLYIDACAPLPQDTTQNDIAAAYISLCTSDSPPFSNFFTDAPQNALESPIHTFVNARTPLAVYAGKKYKPVAVKVRPVETELPSRFRITRNIKGDPLKDMPALSP